MKNNTILIVTLTLFSTQFSSAFAQGTAFIYPRQRHLRFAIYDL